jgi:hypothetical protein
MATEEHGRTQKKTEENGSATHNVGIFCVIPWLFLVFQGLGKCYSRTNRMTIALLSRELNTVPLS